MPETDNDNQAPTSDRLNRFATVTCGAAVVLFVASQCVNPAPANDLFWQLRTGALIVHQHAAPHFDTFSWTRSGTPWVVHEWLTFVLFWEVYRSNGFAGLWLLTAGIASITWMLFYRLALRETQISRTGGERDASRPSAPVFAMLLGILSVTLTGPFLQPRPQLFTYLFATVTVGAVMAFRRADSGLGKGDGRIYLLVPMFCLWANLHAGVLIGLGIVGVFAVGDMLVAAVDGAGARAAGNAVPVVGMQSGRTLAIVAVACFAATLINPYSYHEYLNVQATVGNATAMNDVTEWGSVNFHDTYGKIIEVYLFIVICGLAFSRLRRDPTEIVVIVVLTHGSITAIRNTPLLALIGTLLAARHLKSAFDAAFFGSREPDDSSIFGPTPGLPITVALLLAFGMVGGVRTEVAVRNYSGTQAGLLNRIALCSIEYNSYPDKACDFIEDEAFPATMRLYNYYDDGGFIIWKMPDRKVFVDSRADIYFGSMLDQIGVLASMPYEWRQILSPYGIDLVVVPASDPQSRNFLAAPEWALVYADDSDLDSKNESTSATSNTFIFVKRLPRYAGLIARCRRDCPAIAGGGMMREYAAYLSLR